MIQSKIVIEGSITAAQMKEFWRQVSESTITGPAFQKFLEHEYFWNGAFPNLNWRKTYHSLGLDQQYAGFLASNPLPFVDGYWNIPALKGVTCNKVVETFRELGVNVQTCCGDLDANTPVNDRDPDNGSYWISCKATVEADEELKNLSANDLKEQAVSGITLPERLLLELAYFVTTGAHLDVENWTLCSGSRYLDGDVPRMCWGSDAREFRVDWFYPGYGYDGLRARAAVSL